MKEIITLNGFMGCGKTMVSQRLAGLLGYSLIDLDHYIEENSGRKIPEIFSNDGEAAFRMMEEEALRGILEDRSGLHRRGAPGLLISLGGGTVTGAECAKMVKERTFCVYLRAGVDTLTSNLRDDFASRPMLAQPEDVDGLRARIEELMAVRSGVYEDCASLVVDTDGKSVEDVARDIAGRL